MERHLTSVRHCNAKLRYATMGKSFKRVSSCKQGRTKKSTLNFRNAKKRPAQGLHAAVQGRHLQRAETRNKGGDTRVQVGTSIRGMKRDYVGRGGGG